MLLDSPFLLFIYKSPLEKVNKSEEYIQNDMHDASLLQTKKQRQKLYAERELGRCCCILDLNHQLCTN